MNLFADDEASLVFEFTLALTLLFIFSCLPVAGLNSVSSELTLLFRELLLEAVIPLVVP